MKKIKLILYFSHNLFVNGPDGSIFPPIRSLESSMDQRAQEIAVKYICDWKNVLSTVTLSKKNSKMKFFLLNIFFVLVSASHISARNICRENICKSCSILNSYDVSQKDHRKFQMQYFCRGLLAVRNCCDPFLGFARSFFV